ncbi:MAG: hypothetical protein JRH01_12285 [Deltaproteobacteria bacterium]|nr:hypothetical protein [Deltaproteobacteria bacterium]MBW2396945.1 hypothetical protein [Deltaproteobacteria bacterium]
MNESVKNCPSCGDEFQAWVERCPDCNIPLVIGGSGSAGAEKAAPEFPPASQLEKVLVGGPWQTRGLADRLAEAGIPCRVDSYPPDSELDTGGSAAAGNFGQGGRGIDLGVYVREADHERAIEIAAAYQTEGLPELDEHDTPEPGTELDACPGCGEPLAADATGCEECGLEFPEVGAEG